MSVDPAQDVAQQGVLGGRATCDQSQGLSPGSVGRSTTGESTAKIPSTVSELVSMGCSRGGSSNVGARWTDAPGQEEGWETSQGSSTYRGSAHIGFYLQSTDLFWETDGTRSRGVGETGRPFVLGRGGLS